MTKRYDIKIIENHEELETVRGLTPSQMETVRTILDRHGIKHTVKPIEEKQ